VIELGAAAALQAHQPIEELPLVIQWPAEVELALGAVETAALELHFMERLVQWPLADLVDHTARCVLAEQHRGRALEHVDAFQAIGFGFWPGLGGGAT